MSTTTFYDDLILLLTEAQTISEDDRKRYFDAIETGELSVEMQQELANVFDAEAERGRQELASLQEDRAALESAQQTAESEIQGEQGAVTQAASAELGRVTDEGIAAIHGAEHAYFTALEQVTVGDDDAAQADAIRAALKKPESQA